MIYEYKCKKCKTLVAIEKPMIKAAKEERCEVCKSILERVYTIKIKTGDGTK